MPSCASLVANTTALLTVTLRRLYAKDTAQVILALSASSHSAGLASKRSLHSSHLP